MQDRPEIKLAAKNYGTHWRFDYGNGAVAQLDRGRYLFGTVAVYAQQNWQKDAEWVELQECQEDGTVVRSVSLSYDELTNLLIMLGRLKVIGVHAGYDPLDGVPPGQKKKSRFDHLNCYLFTCAACSHVWEGEPPKDGFCPECACESFGKAWIGTVSG